MRNQVGPIGLIPCNMLQEIFAWSIADLNTEYRTKDSIFCVVPVLAQTKNVKIIL